MCADYKDAQLEERPAMAFLEERPAMAQAVAQAVAQAFHRGCNTSPSQGQIASSSNLPWQPNLAG